MGMARIAGLVGGVLGALVVAAVGAQPAWAAACVTPKTTAPPVAYASPAVGTNLVFKITRNPDSKYKEIQHERYRVKSVEGNSVRWYREPMHGKGPNEDITMYLTFGRLESDQWVYQFDRKKLDKLWPLKQGNEAAYDISARQKKDISKEVLKLKVQFCVRGSKNFKIDGVTYSAQLVDTTLVLEKGPKNLGWDRAEVGAWYSKEIGFALLMEDRYLKQGKPVLIQRREVVEVDKK